MRTITNVWSEPVPIPFLHGRSKGYRQLAPGESLDIEDGTMPKDILKEIERLEKKSRITIASIERSVNVIKDEVSTLSEVSFPESDEDIEKLEQALLADDPQDSDE